MKSLTGVTGILNLIEVRPAVRQDVVKSEIEDALKRLAELDAQRIQVDTVGSKVILRGTVRSWLERKEAERVAWQAPGVTKVDNQIEVVDVVERPASSVIDETSGDRFFPEGDRIPVGPTFPPDIRERKAVF